MKRTTRTSASRAKRTAPRKKSAPRVAATAKSRSSGLAVKRTRAAGKVVKAEPRRAATPATRRRVAVPAPQRRADGSALHWTEELRDGTHVIIRPIDKRDAALERRFIERLSPESRRMRFLGQISVPSEAMIRQLTDVDYRKDMAFIALVHRDGETQEIGVSRFSTSADGTSCECAVTVSDEWHNRGLATILMRHLIDVARERGIRTMVSYDAVENNDMRQLADFLGFARRADPDDSHMVIHRLAL